MIQTKEATLATIAAQARGFATIAVHVVPELASSHLTEAAARLAREFDARLIGIGAEAMETAVVTDPNTGQVVAEWVAASREQVQHRLNAAEDAFRRDAAGVDTEWRAEQAFPNRALVRAGDTADLIVAGPLARGASNYRDANPAEVVMSAGRPVLIVPRDGRHLRGQHVVVAWKQTPESRRAVADALPLLKRAKEVIVQAICDNDDMDAAAAQTEAVAAALKRHGVTARADVRKAHAHDVAAELERVADLNDADLIVAGAYGHARLREWIFGGVTEELVHDPHRFVLLSH